MTVEDRARLAGALDAARRLRCAVIVARLDRLSRDVAFISGLMARRVPSVVEELGVDLDMFVLHQYASLAKRMSIISERTKVALAVKKAAGVVLGNRTNLSDAQLEGRQAREHASIAFSRKMMST